MNGGQLSVNEMTFGLERRWEEQALGPDNQLQAQRPLFSTDSIYPFF